LGASDKVSLAGGLQGGLCEEQPGLPCARQLVADSSAMDPLQGTAELIGQLGGTSEKYI